MFTGSAVVIVVVTWLLHLHQHWLHNVLQTCACGCSLRGKRWNVFGVQNSRFCVSSAALRAFTHTQRAHKHTPVMCRCTVGSIQRWDRWEESFLSIDVSVHVGVKVFFTFNKDLSTICIKKLWKKIRLYYSHTDLHLWQVNLKMYLKCSPTSDFASLQHMLWGTWRCIAFYDLPPYLDRKHNILFSIDTI